jgi:hypothetical protein
MRKMAFIMTASLLIGGAGVAFAKRDFKSVPEAKEIGKPISCVPLRQIRETRVHGDQTIDFVMLGRNKVYRNKLPYSCPSLGFEERFSYKTSLSELCSTDIITVLRTSGGSLDSGASCGLGQFQPIEIVRAATK